MHMIYYDLWTVNYGVWILVTLVDGDFHGNYVRRKSNHFMRIMYEIEFPLLHFVKVGFQHNNTRLSSLHPLLKGKRDRQ